MENRVSGRDDAENMGKGNQRANVKQVEWHKLAKPRLKLRLKPRSGKR
jgi:hypothetical protein